MRDPRHVFLLLALLLSVMCGCASIPKGRAAIDSVEIVGAHGVEPGSVTDRLSTTASPKLFGLFRGLAVDYSIYDASALQRDLARVERYYRGRGFFEAHARVGRVIHTSADHVRIEIVVEEGPPVVNGSIVIEGTEDLPVDIARAVHAGAEQALPKGERFGEDAYAAAQVAVLRSLTDRGYAYAKGESDARVDLASHTVEYTFKLNAGIPAVYGDITFVGLDPDGAGPRPQEIDPEPLLFAMHMRAGRPYSSASIDAATQALLDLGVFSSVHIVPKLADPPQPIVPLVVEVEPTKLRAVRVGGGAEFDAILTDLHLLFGWEDHNLLGGLRSLAVEFKPGVAFYPTSTANLTPPTDFFPEERLRVQFRQPGFLEARTDAFIQPELNVYPLIVQSRQPRVPGYVEPKVSVGVDRRFGKRLFAKLLYNLQGELPFPFKGGPDHDIPTVLLSFPQVIAQLDFRDDTVHPHAGFAANLDLQVAGGPFGGTATDLRVQPEVQGYVPIARGVTFAVDVAFGALFPSNYGKSVQQPSLLYPTNPSNLDVGTMYFRGLFAGGPSSNRGYPVRGVAPHGYVGFLNPTTAASQIANPCATTDATCATPIGGFTQWEASAEVRFQISGPFGAALFCDAGDVSQYVLPSPGSLRFDYLHMSCGAGGRYDTPVGPIRLDVGYRIPGLQILGKDPANDPTFGAPPTILGVPLAVAFGIGEAF
ncbi:MAG TPA: BamA/TamA family outer membrane protein [Polyangiaceae bacterium]|jgi:outer membrane protein insertion porin family/translocation and assembly module TamA